MFNYKKPPHRHPFKFKPDKALEAILYLIQKLPKQNRTQFFLNKMLFYADLKHLEDYSRYICGDFYVALKDGPVPSAAYNMLREVGENHEFSSHGIRYNDSIKVEKGQFVALRDPDTDLLSKTDIECLDDAVNRIGHLSFSVLWDISHEEPAYIETVNEQGINETMEVYNIAKYLKDGEDLVKNLTGEL